MNWYSNEQEMQDKFKQLDAAGKRRYELRELDQVRAQQRRERRNRLAALLASFAALFRRRRPEVSAPMRRSPKVQG